ncbi:MAG: heme-dependent oxidative N-demethylase subunit alpha family protein [Deinococcota bacterium]
MSLLAHPVLPFPVDVPTTVRADIYKFTSADTHFALDSDLPRYSRAVLYALTQHLQQSRCIVGNDADGLTATFWHVLSVLAQEYPTWFEVQPQAYVFKNYLWGFQLVGGQVRRLDQPPRLNHHLAEEVIRYLEQRPAPLADALRLSVQEDIAIIQRQPEPAKDQAEALLVCLPSGWDPAEKLGQDFSTIHRPVAHSDRLAKSHANLNKVLFNKPFKRFVWSLVTDDVLCHNPALHTQPELTEVRLEQLFFRSERQTFIPLPKLNRYVFTIRVYSTPLLEVLAGDVDKAKRLEQALASMTPAHLAYKNLTYMRDEIIYRLQEYHLNQTSA